MKVGISGGTGLIGRNLTKYLWEKGDSVRILSRSPNKDPFFNKDNIDFVSRSIPSTEDWDGLDAFVNLAGENLAGVRWTDSAKARFRSSRVDHTESIVKSLKESGHSLPTFIQASAIGYYGSTEDRGEIFREDSPRGEGFLADLSDAWEKASDPLESTNTRLVKVRIGIVLDPKGGALSKLVPVFKSFVGGPIGKGNHGMSWIHILDMVRVLEFLLKDKNTKGAFNATAPNPVSNLEFSKALGGVLQRPSSFWTPPFALQMIFGEGAKVVTEGQMVIPQRLTDSGFEFQYPNLKQALEDLLVS